MYFSFLLTAAEEGAEAIQAAPKPSWFETVFGKLGELTPVTWIAVGALIALAIILLVIARKGKKWTPQMLAMGALSIALSFLLSYIKLFSMPLGGSVTLCSMLPIMLFAYAYGLPHGLLAGLGYGLLQLIQKQPAVADLIGTLLDYPIAFALLALAALGHKFPNKIALHAGILLGGIGRLIGSYLSGVTVYAKYAPYTPALYSLVYNGTYIGIEILMCLVIVSIPTVRSAINRVYKSK